MVGDVTLQQQAAANSVENFRVPFERRFEDAVVEARDRSQELTYALLDNPALKSDVIAAYLPLIYGQAKVAHEEHAPSASCCCAARTPTWSTSRASAGTSGRRPPRKPSRPLS